MLSRLPVRRAAHSRRGVALLMFVMLVFAFFAIAGVAIDMGLANLTQQEMQVATDTAALEGIRLRDAESQPSSCDLHRRPKVSHIVRLVFDDDMKPTGNSWAIDDPEDNPADYDDVDHMHMGAGPGMQVPGAVGDQHIVTSNETAVWDDPVLRYNEVNRQYGDMVSGTYRDEATHAEYGDTYQRPDFEPGVSVTGDSKVQALGFLVRMRRVSGISEDGGQNPYDTEPFVSYRGRPVPFLFSLGSLMHGNGSGMDPRQAGITVRSTAIAVARPALRASPAPIMPDGTPIPNEADFPPATESTHLNMVGLYPFALTLDYWLSRVVPGPETSGGTFHILTSLDVQPADGTLVDVGTGEIVGRFAQYGTCVGQVLQAAPMTELRQEYGYVAIYTDVPGDTGNVTRIIGYGFCHAVRDAATNPPPGMRIDFYSGIKEWGAGTMAEVHVWVAPNGVSSRLDADAPVLSAAEWNEVFAKNRFLTYGPWDDNPSGETTYDYMRVRPGSLLAAALAR